MLRCWLGTEKHCCRRWPLWKSAKRHLKQRFFMRGSVQQMRLRHFKHLNKECPWNSRTATKWSRRELLSCATKRIPKICLNFELIILDNLKDETVWFCLIETLPRWKNWRFCTGCPCQKLRKFRTWRSSWPVRNSNYSLKWMQKRDSRSQRKQRFSNF